MEKFACVLSAIFEMAISPIHVGTLCSRIYVTYDCSINGGGHCIARLSALAEMWLRSGTGRAFGGLPATTSRPPR